MTTPEVVCALGLDKKEIEHRFEKLAVIDARQEEWQSENGILTTILKKIDNQNGNVATLQKSVSSLRVMVYCMLAFLTGIGIVNIPTLIKLIGQ